VRPSPGSDKSSTHAPNSPDTRLSRFLGSGRITGNPHLTHRWPFGRVAEGLPTIRTRSWNTRRATLSSGLSPQPPRRNQLPHRSSTNAAAKPGARPEQAKIGGLFSTYVLPTQKRKSLGARANLTWAARKRCKKDISKPARKGVRCWP
jgi:hypothetical protein